MRVLVTGANGFLGSHVVRILLTRGYQVTAFVLQGTSLAPIEGLACDIYQGDLLNHADLEKAFNECDYVIHTAAITDMWPTKNAFSWKINFELVKDIAQLVRQKHIKKYIHVGTANSFGYGSKEYPGTELEPFNSEKYRLDYINSKKAAQDYLLSQVNTDNPLPVVIINPTFMIGENDMKPGPGEMIISVIKGKVPAYAAGGRSFAAVKDVATTIVDAIDRGIIGSCYITGGNNLNYKQFFSLIGKIANVKPPKFQIPTFIAIVFASLLQLVAKLKKKKPMLTVTMARISGDGHYYASNKAIEQLGYVQTDTEIALREAIDWYQAHGYIS